MTSALMTRLSAAHDRLRTVGVTGTNGKTTTTSMIAAIVAASGEPSARVTTLGAWVDDEVIAGANLVDEFVTTVERAVDRGVRTIAVEMTSKALAGGVARRWRPDVGVFTNLTRDHLDMHGSLEAYLAAKAQLMLALGPGGTAVLNGDDPSSALLAELVAPGVKVLRFSQRSAGGAAVTADGAHSSHRECALAAKHVEVSTTAIAHAEPAPCALVAERVDVSATGTRIALAPGELAAALGGVIELRVVGGVHAQNALAAALAAHALGYSAAAIARGLATFTGVPGRFEVVATKPLVIVDYAHTPDGLVGTLATARALVPSGRVLCVFGCGGNRDRGKRPEMGAIADADADLVVLTSDNPRDEDPRAIALDILTGVARRRARWHVELDRRRAIELAIGMATPNDIVVIAGKGHEPVQEVAGAKLPFSDADVARCAI